MWADSKSWHVITVGTADEPPRGALYPGLTRRLEPTLTPQDGENVLTSRATALVVERSTGDKRTLSRYSDIDLDVQLTAQRLVMHCKNYDPAKWSGDNTLDALTFGVSGEIAWHAGEKVLSRLKTRGKALVGNLYYPWLVKTIAHVPESRREPATLRLLYLTKDSSTAGGFTLCTLDILSRHELDIVHLAEQICSRTATWWLSHDTTLTDGVLSKLAAIRDANLFGNEAVSSVDFPVFRPVHSANPFLRAAAGKTLNLRLSRGNAVPADRRD